jgi:methylated-DNA-[protein]-cysteine S-methyltransferase
MIEPISYTLVPSAFGPIGIAWCEVDQDAKASHSFLSNLFSGEVLADGLGNQAAKAWHIFLSDGAARAEDRLAAAYPDCRFASHPAIDRLADRIKRLLSGAAVTFDLSSVVLERCTPFQQRVLLAEYAIPRGKVSTYGRIAAHLGVPRGARAVGNALARNPFPLVIPCHRAIRADGTLGGYRGGLEMKRHLLQMEGVQVSDSGRAIDPVLYY